MLLNSGPIPPDPGYDRSSRDAHFVNTCVARIKPEAEKIALHHQGTIQTILENRPLEVPIRKQRRNHIKENIGQVRDLQAKKRVSAVQNVSVKMPVLTETTKYDSIQPKVTKHMKHSRPYSAPTAELQAPMEKKNFILLNKKHAKVVPARSLLPSPAPEKLPDCKIGEIPKYLQHRRKIWQQKKEREEATVPDPTVPDGHVVMPTADRVKTLEALQHNKKTLIDEMLLLPITCQTLKSRQRKMNIECKLSELDDAIKIFSRPRVFIKVEVMH